MAFAWPEGKRCAVSLSFDDARPSQLDAGVPLFAEYGVHASFYVLPCNVEKRIEDWRAAAAAGHELGNHTMSHPCSGNFAFSRENALEGYTLARMERELLECNRCIETLCGVTPHTFAYPCGQTYVGRGPDTRSYVPLVAKHFLAGRGFPNECANAPAFMDLAQSAGCSFDQLPFDALRKMIETAGGEGGWLVLAGHDIGGEDRHQTVHTDALRALCEFAMHPANGIWMDTVSNVASYIREWQEHER